MKLRALLFASLLAMPAAGADSLPELGDVSQSVISPMLERRIGESIMERIRLDRSYVEDPEATDYLAALGGRLVAAGPDSRQPFEFFLIGDSSVNAFALPGGFIGVHSGLVLTAQSESELAAVLAHEIAHVTQRHIARMVAGQQRAQLTSLAAIALAILAARSNSQVSQAVIAGSQAATIQSQLDYSRDHEREADRIGFQILEKAGFDVRAMPVFLERLQKATRFYESNAPSYLRTHPVTFERIADLQGRTEQSAYRQVADNPDFQLVRARLRALLDEPRTVLAQLEESLRERRFLSEAATRYGLTLVLLRLNQPMRARAELAALESLLPHHPMVATLRGTFLVASGDLAAAEKHYLAAREAHPRHRALLYDQVEVLLRRGRAAEALKIVTDAQVTSQADVRLWFLQAKAHAALGRRLLQHRAQAEGYVRQGNLGAAIEQLQIALAGGDGDFYQLSSAEARLRELRREESERRKQ